MKRTREAYLVALAIITGRRRYDDLWTDEREMLGCFGYGKGEEDAKLAAEAMIADALARIPE